MPTIDVSDLTTDPDFCTELTIERREEEVDNHGRAHPAKYIVTPKPIGVLVPMENPRMMRGPDEQHGQYGIEVHTQFRLRGPAKDMANQSYQPDVIIYNGGRYVIENIRDFSIFGAGFISAYAYSMEAIDAATN